MQGYGAVSIFWNTVYVCVIGIGVMGGCMARDEAQESIGKNNLGPYI